MIELSKLLSKVIGNQNIVNILCSDSCEEEKKKCIYKELYGNTLTPEMCEEFIAEITSSPKWTLNEVSEAAKKIDIDFAMKSYTLQELRAAMIAEYDEHYDPLKRSNCTLESTGWARIGDAWLTKKPGRLVEEYFEE